MGTLGVVVGAVLLTQHLVFECRGEQLSVEEFIA